MALHHFLLIYDHEKQSLVEAMALDSPAATAARTYSEYEEKYRDRPGIEIVLVGADSLDTIRATHAHYFEHSTASDPFAELLVS